MTKSVKDKINKFLNQNRDDLELITLFKYLVKIHPELFTLDGQPFLSRDLPLRTYGYLKENLIKIHEFEKYSKQQLKEPKESVMKFITDSQLNGVYNQPVINEIRAIEREQKEKQEFLKKWKLVKKTYEDLPKYVTNFFDYNAYYSESQKFVSEWEKLEIDKPEIFETNLRRLRNLKYD